MPHRQGMDTLIFLDQVVIVGQIPADMKAGETKAVWQTPSLEVLTLVKDPWVVAPEDLMLRTIVMAWTWGLGNYNGQLITCDFIWWVVCKSVTR